MIHTIFENWPSLIIYTSLFIVSAYLVHLGGEKTKYSKGLRYLCISTGLSIPVILAGLRYNVGRDFHSYANMVENLIDGHEMYHRPLEPLSTLIIHISSYFGRSEVMFALFSIITILFAYIAIKRFMANTSEYTALAYLSYLLISFPISLNLVRNSAAMSISAYAFSVLLNTDDKMRLAKFILFSILASLFHISAIIYIPIGLVVYFLSNNKGGISKVELALLAASSVLAIAFPLFGNVISHVPITLINNYSRFLTQLGDHFFIPISSLLVLGILLLTLIINRDEIKENERLRVVYSIAMYYIPFAILVGWLSYHPGISRLVFFFDLMLIAILSYTIKSSRFLYVRKYNVYNITIIVIILFNLAMFVRNLNWSHALPYTTVYKQEIHNENEN